MPTYFFSFRRHTLSTPSKKTSMEKFLVQQLLDIFDQKRTLIPQMHSLQQFRKTLKRQKDNQIYQNILKSKKTTSFICQGAKQQKTAEKKEQTFFFFVCVCVCVCGALTFALLMQVLLCRHISLGSEFGTNSKLSHVNGVKAVLGPY